MSNIIMVILFLAIFCSFSGSTAAIAEKLGPKSINLKMGDKTTAFSHEKHQKLTNNQCWECHDKKKGKIENWGEATAHKLCIPCHDLYQKGPVKCKACHKK